MEKQRKSKKCGVTKGAPSRHYANIILVVYLPYTTRIYDLNIPVDWNIAMHPHLLTFLCCLWVFSTIAVKLRKRNVMTLAEFHTPPTQSAKICNTCLTPGWQAEHIIPIK